MTYTLPREVERAVLTLCQDLATPVSLGVSLRIKHGCWDDLASMRVIPEHYLDADSYWRDSVAVSILRKCQDLPTNFDRKAKAVENFWLSERQCFSTNQRLRPYLYGKAYAPEDEGIWRFILQVRKNVAALLGPCPDFPIIRESRSLDGYDYRNERRSYQDGRFGPGATFGDRGQLTTVPDKMSSRPTLTRDACWFMFPWTGTAWASACAADRRDPTFVRGNRFTTVPKDCEKDRGICIEPSINLFYQLAYGKVMKARLGRSGFDLINGQDIHRQVACEASIKGHLATLDLSNASDTVCKELVELLLPMKWFEVLSDLRSTHTLLDGKWVLLEKFSSMGNGYTFELETVIFAAISMAAMELVGIQPLPGKNVYVFGDDIIVPTESAECVIASLRYLGFTPNKSKSFVSGPFRESCGGDFFNGVEVRPYYLEEYPREPQQYIAMANGLRKLADSDSFHGTRSRFLARAWFCILDAIPSDVRRLRGPQDLGDLVIHDEHEHWNERWRSGIRYIRCYRPASFRRVDWRHFKPDVALASALYGVGDGVLGVTPRDAVTGYKVGWVPRS